MTTAVLYLILTTGLYYLTSRAEITRWLWSRYPNWVNQWALCSACSGFWYGLGVAGGLGWTLDLPLLGLPGRAWFTVAVGGVVGMVGTPIVAYYMISSWTALSDTDEGERPDDNDTAAIPTINRPDHAA